MSSSAPNDRSNGPARTQGGATTAARPPGTRVGRRVDRYVLGELIPPLLFGLLLYSGLIVTSAVLGRLQWVVGTPVVPMLRWFALQVPTAIVQTLPIALVLAVLLAFGRLAHDRELLALRAGGVSLGRIVRPAIVLGVLATLAAVALNQWVLPETQARVGSDYWELTAERSGLFRLAAQGVPIGDFELTFEEADRGGDVVRDVRVERWDGDVLTVIRARRGAFEDTSLVLYDYEVRRIDVAAFDDPSATVSDVLLLATGASGEDRPLDVTADDLVARFSGGGFEDTRSISELWADSRDPDLGATRQRQAGALFHRRLAEPLANLVLLLVALPLSILYSRSRAVAFGLSLVVTLAWYLILTFGQLFAQTGVVPIWLGPWLGNLVLGGLGAVVLALRARGAIERGRGPAGA